MGKQKTTVYLDTDVLTATKTVALMSRSTDSEIIETALRLYLQDGHGESARSELNSLMSRVARRSDLSEDAAMDLAIQEVRASRRSRRGSASAV
jgi:hypothetical protein